jgi:hypothetical protein
MPGLLAADGFAFDEEYLLVSRKAEYLVCGKTAR